MIPFVRSHTCMYTQLKGLLTHPSLAVMTSTYDLLDTAQVPGTACVKFDICGTTPWLVRPARESHRRVINTSEKTNSDSHRKLELKESI